MTETESVSVVVVLLKSFDRFLQGVDVVGRSNSIFGFSGELVIPLFLLLTILYINTISSTITITKIRQNTPKVAIGATLMLA